MHALPEGLTSFYVGDPPPACDEWRNHMPGHRDKDAFELYIRARRLWRSKIEWQLTKGETQQILRDVRSAAAKGDWGAKALLAYFYRNGLGPLPSNQVLTPDADAVVAITREAVRAGQPWGYYDLGVAHEHGYGGAVHDQKIAWAYYLKAASLGSPEAQMALADAYSRAGIHKYAEVMHQCAFAQGHGPAARALGMTARIEGRVQEAIHLYQEGVKMGGLSSVEVMYLFFLDGSWMTSSAAEKRSWKRLM